MSKDDEFKEIIIKRLEAMPDNIKISMGSIGTFSKEDLIRNVVEGTDLGKFIVKMQTEYLKSMSTGFSK